MRRFPFLLACFFLGLGASPISAQSNVVTLTPQAPTVTLMRGTSNVSTHPSMAACEAARDAAARAITQTSGTITWKCRDDRGVVASYAPATVFSTKFAVGQQVQALTTVNVRQTPGGPLLGTQPTGAIATVLERGIQASLNGTPYFWPKLQFASGPSGYAGENNFEAYTAPPPPPPPALVACNDGLDNDGDGVIDLADPGCASAADTDETNAVAPPPPPPTSSTNYFVRPGGTGNGSNWINAWGSLSGIAWASVPCGASVWVAGGTYGSVSPAKTCPATNRLMVRRARADVAAVTSAAGWQDSYDSTVRMNRASITLTSAAQGIGISGASQKERYGWLIDYAGASQGAAIEWPNGSTASNNLLEYLDVKGPGNVTYSGDGRGIDMTPFTGAASNTFSHLAVHDWESAIYIAGTGSGNVFEYLDVFDIMAVNWATWHPNGIYTSGAPNVTVRYSKFHRGPGGNGVGEGIFFEQSGGSTGWQIYGNLFYDLNATGLKSIQATSNVGAIKIYNNTFDNTGVPGFFLNQGSCGSGAEVKNNLLIQSSVATCGSTSNNVTAVASDFVNRAARDYHLTIAKPGVSLPAPFALDLDGVTRGADGTFDAGAFEFR